MIVAIRGLATRQATLTLDERGVHALADAIENAVDDSGRPLASPEIVRLGEQLRGFAEVWDDHPLPEGD